MLEISTAPLRLLIVKFSSIGDCVMAVPVASRVRRARPDAFIGWAVDPRCRAVLAGPPLLDLIYEIPWETWKRQRAGMFVQLRHYLKLREYRFDVGLDLQGHAKTAICLRLSGAKKRLSARAKDPLPKILNPLAPRLGAVHTVERNLETLGAVVQSDADARPIMPPLAKVEAPAGLVTVAVGTGLPQKVYRRWGEAAERLMGKGHKVAFLGGPEEEAPDVPGALDLVGKLSLDETMAWVGASAVHLAADTGTGHIAAAYGVPVVSVFGWTKASEYGPYTDNATVLDAGPDMTGVEPDLVVEAACAYLS